jgi:hypothetical protein
MPTIQLLENNRPDGQKTKFPVGLTNLRGFRRSRHVHARGTHGTGTQGNYHRGDPFCRA